MRRVTCLSLLTASLILATGCDDTPPEPGGDVVGTWRELPNDYELAFEPEEERLVWTFRADGTATYGRPGLSYSGTATYETDNGRLRVIPDDPAAPLAPFDVGYYADGGAMILALLLPDDDGADAVARWTGRGSQDGYEFDTFVIVRDDGTAQLDWGTPYDGPVDEATWTERGDSIEVSYVDEGSGYTLSHTFDRYAGFMGQRYEPID